MKSRRQLKAASAIREVVSTAILLELRDPRVKNVTVTGVEVAADMRLAKVYVSIMGDQRQQQLTLHGLRHSAGFLQQRIGERIDTRYIPRLQFVVDKGVKQSLEVARILQEVLPEHEEASNPAQTNPAQDLPADSDSATSARRDPADPLDDHPPADDSSPA